MTGSKSQRALAAARASEVGTAVAHAAEFGVGERTVRQALALLRSGRADLIQAVEGGRMTLKVADKHARRVYAAPAPPLTPPPAARAWGWRAVLAGEASHSVDCADALDLVRSLPDNSIDLLLTSPPFPRARDYGIGAVRSLDEWVTWMCDVVAAAAPKVTGLMCINCEGPVEDYRYLPAPALLMAELHRRGFNLRPPLVYHRQGTPGKYGDWLRRDHESVCCISRPGPLPWSDATACGAPPKNGPGFGFTPSTRGSRIKSGRRRATTAKQYPDGRRVMAGDVIRCPSGGGRMGSPLAHENEAPMSLALADFVVRTFCKPGGVVLDPFAGSGTTIAAAVTAGRWGVAGDIRQSQVDLTRRRMAEVGDLRDR